MTTEAALGSCSENDFPERQHSLKVSVRERERERERERVKQSF